MKLIQQEGTNTWLVAEGIKRMEATQFGMNQFELRGFFHPSGYNSELGWIILITETDLIKFERRCASEFDLPLVLKKCGVCSTPCLNTWRTCQDCGVVLGTSCSCHVSYKTGRYDWVYKCRTCPPIAEWKAPKEEVRSTFDRIFGFGW